MINKGSIIVRKKFPKHTIHPSHFEQAKHSHPMPTIDREIFGGKIFSAIKFSSGFISVTMTTRRCILTPFIRGRNPNPKRLISIVEDDRQKFFVTKFSQSTVCHGLIVDIAVALKRERDSGKKEESRKRWEGKIRQGVGEGRERRRRRKKKEGEGMREGGGKRGLR